ncbi:MAG: hypothetical protein R2785_10325 [Flavobacteriaceae bacterium]
MKKFTTLLVSITILHISNYIMAQDKTIDFNKDSQPILKPLSIKDQITRYLVYVELPNGTMSDISIWERNVKLKNDEIIVKQSWANQDKTKNRIVYSVSDKKTFLPKYHKSVNRDSVIEAYDFYTDKIVGADSIANNSKKDFNLELSNSGLPHNWELDLEMLQMLPYQLNRTFSLFFYHPGGKTAPKYYNYTVINEEKLSTSYGVIDTWVLQIIYDIQKDSKATFWIRKSDNMVIKMYEKYGPVKRVKQII